MNQTIYFIKLRLKMVGRLGIQLGWIRAVVLVSLILFFWGHIVISSGAMLNWSVSSLGAIIIVFLHINRKDTAFLQQVFTTRRLILALEYIMLASFLFFPLAYKGALLPAGILIIFAIGLPFIVPSGRNAKRNSKQAVDTQFPVHCYEWIAGFRNHRVVLIGLLGIAVLFLWAHYLVGWLVAFGLTLTTSAFYAQTEPRRFITLVADAPSTFLLKKVAWGIGLYTLCTLPIWIGSLFLFTEQYLFTLYSWFVSVVLLASVIIGKYAFYRENHDLSLLLGGLFSFFGSCFLLPHLQLVGIFCWGFLIAKSINRLENRVYA